MKFAALTLAVLCLGLIGCSVSEGPPGTTPGGLAAFAHVSPKLQYFTPTPPPGHLYVDHDGTLYVYALPLKPAAKPLRSIVEEAGQTIAPQIAADQFGNVAIATPTQIQLFHAPIRSFAAKNAYLTIPFTPAITQIGPSGADLADLEFDPDLNLWILNNYGGGEASELQAPLRKYAVAAAQIQFGVPGTKASSYGNLRNARFDQNSTIYVYATQPQGQFSELFKNGFPYATYPGSYYGLDLSVPDFVDPSQWPNGPPPALASGVLLGQYNGSLASPAPGKSPTPAVSVLAEFNLPIIAVNGVYPSAYVNDTSAAIVADASRMVFYSLAQANGALDVYALPLATGAKPIFAIPCAAKLPALCDDKPEHLFLAP